MRKGGPGRGKRIRNSKTIAQEERDAWRQLKARIRKWENEAMLLKDALGPDHEPKVHWLKIDPRKSDREKTKYEFVRMYLETHGIRYVRIGDPVGSRDRQERRKSMARDYYHETKIGAHPPAQRATPEDGPGWQWRHLEGTRYWPFKMLPPKFVRWIYTSPDPEVLRRIDYNLERERGMPREMALHPEELCEVVGIKEIPIEFSKERMGLHKLEESN